MDIIKYIYNIVNIPLRITKYMQKRIFENFDRSTLSPMTHKGGRPLKPGTHPFEQPQLETLADTISKQRGIAINRVRREILERASELLEEGNIPQSSLERLEMDLRMGKF